MTLPDASAQTPSRITVPRSGRFDLTDRVVLLAPGFIGSLISRVIEQIAEPGPGSLDCARDDRSAVASAADPSFEPSTPALPLPRRTDQARRSVAARFRSHRCRIAGADFVERLVFYNAFHLEAPIFASAPQRGHRGHGSSRLTEPRGGLPWPRPRRSIQGTPQAGTDTPPRPAE